VFGVYLVFI